MSKKNNTKSSKIKKSLPIYPAKTKLQVTVIFFAILIMYLFSIYWTQRNMVGGIGDALGNMVQVMGNFFPPNFSYWNQIWDDMAQTIQMAIIATTIAAILTVPLALLSARNITTFKPLYYVTRTFLNLLRTIPDLVLAVIFVGLFGIGLFPGILALIVFSLGILAKLISETIETVDMQPLEAMRASGGGTLQVIWTGLVPQVLPQFTSLVLYVFEINVRASVVLGYVGAGGIGLILNQQLSFGHFAYPNAMAIIILIFIVVVVIEYISSKLREALL